MFSIKLNWSLSKNLRYICEIWPILYGVLYNPAPCNLNSYFRGPYKGGNSLGLIILISNPDYNFLLVYGESKTFSAAQTRFTRLKNSKFSKNACPKFCRLSATTNWKNNLRTSPTFLQKNLSQKKITFISPNFSLRQI